MLGAVIAVGIVAGLALVLGLESRVSGPTFDGPDDPGRFDWED